MAPPDSCVFRPLRRSDYASYYSVVHQSIGPFERATGLDVNSEATIAQLSRRWVWLLLRLLRLFGRRIVDIEVATQGTEVVGTATILWLPRTAYVAAVATRPELRGRGIASRLMALLAERARRYRRAWMALDVETENEVAIRVYRRAGYQTVGSYSWFSRADLPTVESPPSSEVTPVGSADVGGLCTRLDANRPVEYREAFPADRAALTHNEILVRGGRVELATWKRELTGGGVAVLRAYYVPGTRMAAYFPISTAPEGSPDDFGGLIDAATGWLRPRSPSRVIAVAPEPRGNSTVALERRGFPAVASTTTMVARVVD